MPARLQQFASESSVALKSRTIGCSSATFVAEHVGVDLDWSIHRDEHTAVLHISGPITHLESEIEGMGAKLNGARTGELWLIPAGHHYHSRATGGDIKYAVMTLPADQIELAPQMAQFDPFLLSCFRRMESAMKSGDEKSDLMVEQLHAVIQSHLHLTYSSAARTPRNRIADDARFLKVERSKLIDFIDANIESRVSVRDLAELTGRTTHQLIDACHDAFGMPPSQLVMKQRLRRARDLLATSSETITAIAVATGFSSHSHFIRAFQQHYAMTPGQFRSDMPR